METRKKLSIKTEARQGASSSNVVPLPQRDKRRVLSGAENQSERTLMPWIGQPYYRTPQQGGDKSPQGRTV